MAITAVGQAIPNLQSEIVAIKMNISEVVAKVTSDSAAAAAAAAAAASASGTNNAAPVFDPWAGATFGQSGTEHFDVGTTPSTPAHGGPAYGGGSGVTTGPDGRWRLYDEKWMLSGEGKYNASKAQTWLKDVKDYLAGRTSDMDALLNWVEKQEDEIVGEESGGGSAPMVCFAPSVKEVSRQLWALLQALTKHDATVAGNFANVPRHNGLEAWRRIGAHQ